MKFTKKDLDWAVGAGVLAQETCDALSTALEERYKDQPSLTFANVLYYLGGLIVIGAMTFYATTAWESLGGFGHLAVALIYALVFLATGGWLWHSKGLRTPGGILVAAAVCMTPMAVYGVQEMSGWWVWDSPGMYEDFYHWIKGGWFFMEVVTVLAGLAAFRFFRFPFITLPIAFSLWFLSMDLTALLYGPDFSWDQRKLVSLWFGLCVLVASYAVDRRTKEDFAFWGYLFGMLAFWGGLSSLDSDSELSKFIYCCINLVLMGLSVLIQRRVFIVFGSIGVFAYLGHLANTVFDDVLVFTFALTGLGLAIIGLGVKYHKHRKLIEEKLLGAIPEVVRKTLPQYRR